MLCSILRPRSRRPIDDAPIPLEPRLGLQSKAFQTGSFRQVHRTRVAPIAGSCRRSKSYSLVLRGARSAVYAYKPAIFWEAPGKRLRGCDLTGMLDPKVMLPHQPLDVSLWAMPINCEDASRRLRTYDRWQFGVPAQS
jgi:hypothetical protein